MFIDRRRDRSDKAYEAVKKQLEAVASDGDFQTAILADGDGLIIAASNSNPVNESLGVIGGSLLSKQNGNGSNIDKTYVLHRRDGLNKYSIVIHHFTLLDQDVMFMALGENFTSVKPLITRAVDGTKRILEN